MERRMVLPWAWQVLMSCLWGVRGVKEESGGGGAHSISGQLRSWVPAKTSHLSPALAKLRRVGFLMLWRNANGMTSTLVSVEVC